MVMSVVCVGVAVITPASITPFKHLPAAAGEGARAPRQVVRSATPATTAACRCRGRKRRTPWLLHDDA